MHEDPDSHEPAPDTDDTNTDDAAAAEAARARKEQIGRYVFAFLFPFLMVVMMVSGYLGSMHAPSPHDMPIAVAGSTAQDVASALESADASAVDVRVVADDAEARQLVEDREVAGAVSVSADGASASVYTAGAAGASQGQSVATLVTPTLVGQGLDVHAEDLVPLPSHDMAGLSAMFMMTGLLLAGYMPLSIALSNAPELLRLRRFVPILAGWSAVVSGLVWLIAGPILGGIEGHTAEVLGVAWLAVFAVGMVQLFFTRILGPLAVLLGLLLIMVLGVPASNMGMSIYTVPAFFRTLYEFLPAPAVGESLRSVLYFGGDGAGKHLLVLAIGAVVAILLTMGIDALKRKRNPDAGDPAMTMPSLTGGSTPPSTPVRYAILAAFPLAMVALMASLMTSGMYKPMPHDVPVTVVAADAAQAEQAAAGLGESMTGMFEFTPSTSVDDARAAVEDRSAVAAYVLPSAQTPHAELITAGAGGMGQQQLVARTFEQVAGQQGFPMETTDVVPLDSEDTMGTVSMYLAIGWIMAGFLLAMVLTNAAPDLARLRKYLPIAAIWSVVMSAVVWLIAGPIIGAVSGHFLPLWGIGALAIFAISLFSSVLVRMIGIISVIPIVTLFMFLGVPASGGGVSVYMVPGLFRWLHDVLPLPAAVESARSILYFGGTGVGSHALTLAIWGVVGLVALVAYEAITGRRKPEPEDLVAETDERELEPAR
ncbi:ABC transporter permease [Rhodococcus sp. HNM0569]|nr:ABC transporter permease [Rhodococcus sp. HNM0569]